VSERIRKIEAGLAIRERWLVSERSRENDAYRQLQVEAIAREKAELADWRALSPERAAAREARHEYMRHYDEQDTKLRLMAAGELRELGRSPHRRHRFHAAVQCEIRCRSKGHELAAVYRTSAGPLLVATRAKLAHEKAGIAPDSVKRRENPGAVGAEWTRQDRLADPYGGSAYEPAIIFSPTFCRFCLETEAVRRNVKPLWCRCGEQRIILTSVAQALRDGTPRLFASTAVLYTKPTT